MTNPCFELGSGLDLAFGQTSQLTYIIFGMYSLMTRRITLLGDPPKTITIVESTYIVIMPGV